MAIAETARLIAQLVLDDKLTPGVNKALGSVGRLDKGMGRTAQGLGKVQSGLFKAGTRIALVAGTAAAGAAKIAIDFDDAFAVVQKNVEGGTAEIAKLKDDLHALATRIPVKFDDLTAIASEAGALGIATPDIIRFTETMARLSQATQGLTVEAASEAFGKFKNSLHLTEDEIERSASALVTLGRTAGSSEGDIIEVAKRFAGAGHTAGLSAAQILGLSSAIESLGVAPEAAGGSLSRLFNNLNKYIGTGDKKLNSFAKTAGMTGKQFAKSFQKDALGSFQKFLQGLSKMSGPAQQRVLKAAGVTQTRDINALQLLAQSWQEVQKNVDNATGSYKQNTDLTERSNTRFDTLSKKLTLLGNNFKEVGFQVGEGMVPALGRAADKLTKLLQDKGFLERARKIGTTIGEAIDSIDWNQVIRGAQSFADALKPALALAQNVFNILNALPTEVKGAGLGLIGLNKLSGGLIGSGIGDIFGGLGESLARSLASKIPLFGSAFVQPVFVTNMGAGGLPGQQGGQKGSLLDTLSLFTLAGIGSQVGNTVSHGATDLLSGLLPATDGIRKTFSDAMGVWIDNILPTPASIQKKIDAVVAGPGGGSAKAAPNTGNGLQDIALAIRKPLEILAGKLQTKGIEAKLDKNIDKLGALEKQLAHAKDSGDDRRIGNLRQRIEQTNARIDASKQALTSTTVQTRDAARHAGIQSASATNAAESAIVRAIFAARPDISIFVTAGDVEKSIVYHNRQAPANGSAGGRPNIGEPGSRGP